MCAVGCVLSRRCVRLLQLRGHLPLSTLEALSLVSLEFQRSWERSIKASSQRELNAMGWHVL